MRLETTLTQSQSPPVCWPWSVTRSDCAGGGFGVSSHPAPSVAVGSGRTPRRFMKAPSSSRLCLRPSNLAWSKECSQAKTVCHRDAAWLRGRGSSERPEAGGGQEPQDAAQVVAEPRPHARRRRRLKRVPSHQLAHASRSSSRLGSSSTRHSSPCSFDRSRCGEVRRSEGSRQREVRARCGRKQTTQIDGGGYRRSAGTAVERRGERRREKERRGRQAPARPLPAARRIRARAAPRCRRGGARPSAGSAG